MSVLAELRWPILERIPVAGDFAVSPHGIMIAVGFLLGAQLMLKRAERRGVARRPVPDVSEVVQSLVTRAALGGIIGARFFYVLTHLDAFPDPLSWFRVWEGGLSLIGGITGAVLAGVPYVRRRGYSVPLLLDSVAPGLALGIFVGRIGDLVIGEHLGGPTSFFLGWRCTGDLRDPLAPYPYPGVGPSTVQGCYDVAVHQTAFYDFLTGGVIVAAILLLERKPRFDGFSMVTFGVLYGTARFITDFARDADRDLIGPLTGSQVGALAAIAALLVWVLVRRPDRVRPYAWSPPDFDHPWDPGAQDGPDAAESDGAGPRPVGRVPTGSSRSDRPPQGYSAQDGTS